MLLEFHFRYHAFGHVAHSERSRFVCSSSEDYGTFANLHAASSALLPRSIRSRTTVIISATLRLFPEIAIPVRPKTTSLLLARYFAVLLRVFNRSLLILRIMPALRSATSLTLYSAEVPSTWATSDGVSLYS